MYDWYNIGKDQGNIIGQGLMSAGQTYSNTVERQKQENIRKEEVDQRKGLALLSVYSQITADMEPEQRLQIYTTRLLPTLVQSGVLPKDIDSTETYESLKAMSMQNSEALQQMTGDAQNIIKLINDGNQDEAENKTSEFITKYGRRKSSKALLEPLTGRLETGRKEIAAGKKLEATEKKKEQDYIDKKLATGELSELPKDLQAIYDNQDNFNNYTKFMKSQGLDMTDDQYKQAWSEGQNMLKSMLKDKKPIVKDYAGTGKTVIGKSEREKLEKVKKEKKAEADIQLEKDKLLVDYKSQADIKKEKKLTDAQLLDAFEQAEKALSERVMTGQAKYSMTEPERRQWKIDWVNENIANVEDIKNPPKNKVKGKIKRTGKDKSGRKVVQYERS